MSATASHHHHHHEHDCHDHDHEHHHHHHEEGGMGAWIAPAKALLLLGMGLYLTLLIASGNLTNYINLRFAWLAYIGAAIFLILGLVSAYSLRRPPAAPLHTHYRIGWDVLLIIAFPLLLALFLPSRALGVEAINGGVSLRPVGAPAAFSRSPLDRNVLDWLREFDRAAPVTFNGAPADVSGFVYREPSFAPEEFMLSRFTMSCCVADAFPIGMPARADAAAEYATGAWLRVRGELRASAFDGELLPVLLAHTLEAIDEPAQPYLYP